MQNDNNHVASTNHLSDETLIDYANGSLSMEMETLVVCHLSVCPHCRNRNDVADFVGGALLAYGSSSQPTMSAEQLLEKSRAKPNISVTNPPKPVNDTTVPRALGRLLPAPLEKLNWATIAPGVKQYSLSNKPRKEGAFKLLYLAPGVTLSHHTHHNKELTYVVRGSYRDDFGHFKAGDVADLDSHDSHRPVVDADEVCIALIATESPVRYTSVLGKIMQPFVGI